jgi:hypothetical protein
LSNWCRKWDVDLGCGTSQLLNARCMFPAYFTFAPRGSPTADCISKLGQLRHLHMGISNLTELLLSALVENGCLQTLTIEVCFSKLYRSYPFSDGPSVTGPAWSRLVAVCLWLEVTAVVSCNFEEFCLFALDDAQSQMVRAIMSCDYEEFCLFTLDDAQSQMPLVAVEAHCECNLYFHRIMSVCQKHAARIQKLQMQPGFSQDYVRVSETCSAHSKADLSQQLNC